MWNRACPLCFAKVPRTLLLTRGDEFDCPSCHKPLELSRASRAVSAAVGLMGGYAAARAGLGFSGDSRWLMPMVAGLLAYGMVSALVLYFLSDLVVQAKPGVSHFPQAQK